LNLFKLYTLWHCEINQGYEEQHTLLTSIKQVTQEHQARGFRI